MKFEWNRDKAASNLLKHGVSFTEAQTVFSDPLYIDFYDPDRSENEDRYIIIGASNQRRVLIVAYTERESAIRIISAREVTKTERKVYEEG
jgi:uncharacterized DUF497 family protein